MGIFYKASMVVEEDIGEARFFPIYIHSKVCYQAAFQIQNPSALEQASPSSMGGQAMCSISSANISDRMSNNDALFSHVCDTSDDK